MATIYNPKGRNTNCGFCAIAHALRIQGTNTDADQLYLQTLERLGIPYDANHDPIPRQLIFPDPLIDGIPLPVGYQALAAAGHGPASYTITAVASAQNLRYALSNRDLSLQRQFFEFYARTGSGSWNIAGFVNMRQRWLQSQGKSPTADALRRHIMEQLGGHSIMGSKTVNHFINVEIDGSGHIQAFDAQDGRQYNGSALHNRLGTVDLFMHLR